MCSERQQPQVFHAHSQSDEEDKKKRSHYHYTCTMVTFVRRSVYMCVTYEQGGHKKPFDQSKIKFGFLQPLSVTPRWLFLSSALATGKSVSFLGEKRGHNVRDHCHLHVIVCISYNACFTRRHWQWLSQRYEANSVSSFLWDGGCLWKSVKPHQSV